MSYLDQEIVELIEFEIEHSMHYVGYPNDVHRGMWRNAAGERQYISDMVLEHLKASVRKVERDIADLERSGRPVEVVNILVPKAKSVLAELKEEFTKQAHL